VVLAGATGKLVDNTDPSAALPPVPLYGDTEYVPPAPPAAPAIATPIAKVPVGTVVVAVEPQLVGPFQVTVLVAPAGAAVTAITPAITDKAEIAPRRDIETAATGPRRSATPARADGS
jgi:hypothetical protein